MTNILFSVGDCRFVAYGRTCAVSVKSRFIIVCDIAQAVFPRPPYLVLVGVIIFEIIYNQEVGRGEAPDRALPGTVGMDVVDFINTPVVGRVPVKRLRRKTGIRLPALIDVRRTGICGGNSSSIRT